MPEEIFKGLTRNSRDVFPREDIAEFLEDWADREGFVKYLEHLVDSTNQRNVSPEKVFEHLASSPYDYSVEEMLDLAEGWSSGEWSDKPSISCTGKPDTPTLGDKARVPREDEFIPLSSSYIGETEFREEDKRV